MALTSLELPGIESVPEVRDFLTRAPRMLIGGELVEAAAGETFATHDPATGALLAEVPLADAEDVDRAVAAARRALATWRTTSPRERETVLGRVADLLERHAEELAELETLDNGKPLAYARTVDLPLAIDHFRYFAGWPTKIEGAIVDVGTPGVRAELWHEPVGVVGAIIAWNFPLIMTAWKLAPALAAGCTVVLKPAEQTSLTALRLGELLAEAGVPDGVVNICTGPGDRAGEALVRHPGVDLVAFTGSTAVGRRIAAIVAEGPRQVALELGGKSPHIVFADGDLEAAAQAAATAIFYESGQVCCAGSRLLVEAPVYDEFLEAVVRESRALRLGPGLDPSVTMGPLVSEAQRTRVSGLIEQGREAGARVLTGGGWPDGELSSGFFLEPTILADVKDDDAVCQQEIFGPVLVAQSFTSVDELLVRANGTPYGLASGIWTSNGEKARAVAAQLDAGVVWVNGWGWFDAAVPFGGVKQSGYGRDGGRHALEKFLRTKSVWERQALSFGA